MLKRALKSTLIAAAVVVSLITGVGFYYLWMEPSPAFNPPRMVSIERGDTVRAITNGYRMPA